jgi:hypothetical protein
MPPWLGRLRSGLLTRLVQSALRGRHSGFPQDKRDHSGLLTRLDRIGRGNLVRARHVDEVQTVLGRFACLLVQAGGANTAAWLSRRFRMRKRTPQDSAPTRPNMATPVAGAICKAPYARTAMKAEPGIVKNQT